MCVRNACISRNNRFLVIYLDKSRYKESNFHIIHELQLKNGLNITHITYDCTL